MKFDYLSLEILDASLTRSVRGGDDVSQRGGTKTEVPLDLFTINLHCGGSFCLDLTMCGVTNVLSVVGKFSQCFSWRLSNGSDLFKSMLSRLPTCAIIVVYESL